MAELDHPQPGSDIAHFIRTLSLVTAVSRRPRLGSLAIVSARLADEIVAGCNLIERIRSERPEIVSGPIDRGRQYWISAEQPDPGQLDEIDVPDWPIVSTKPFYLGLFTSTGLPGSYGMWWSYLHEGRSSLFPEPWNVWHLEPAVTSRVLEITTAAEWAELAVRHPLEDGGLVYPDWEQIAGKWDGIHMTLRAIAATQGICISLDDAVVAPTYWDVESTLWLRWVFAATAEVT